MYVRTYVVDQGVQVVACACRQSYKHNTVHPWDPGDCAMLKPALRTEGCIVGVTSYMVCVTGYFSGSVCYFSCVYVRT